MILQVGSMGYRVRLCSEPILVDGLSALSVCDDEARLIEIDARVPGVQRWELLVREWTSAWTRYLGDGEQAAMAVVRQLACDPWSADRLRAEVTGAAACTIPVIRLPRWQECSSSIPGR